MTVKCFQRVEVEGKTYDVTWYESGLASVRVLTKRGLRTLNGRGRAFRPVMMARVIAAAKAAQPECRA